SAQGNPTCELLIRKFLPQPLWSGGRGGGRGERGDRLTGVARVLQQCTGQTPVLSRAGYAVRAFGSRRNEKKKMAVHCTVRGVKAEEIPEKVLNMWEHELRNTNFSGTRNFGLGIQERVDVGTQAPVLGRASASDEKVRTLCVRARHAMIKEEVMALVPAEG
uniref:Uncharacterized protein n=1 Tax=Panthera leo TaxID=9689 RepID=A0A8C8WEI8_PANLE